MVFQSAISFQEGLKIYFIIQGQEPDNLLTVLQFH